MSDGLRMAVLIALIRRHGSIPCVHVTRVTTRGKSTFTYEASAGGYLPRSDQSITASYICEASELCIAGESVLLELPKLEVPLYIVGEPERFSEPRDALRERDKLCEALARLPWDRTSLWQPLGDVDADVALRHVVVTPEALEVVSKSDAEVAVTLEKIRNEFSPDASEVEE